MFDLIIKFLKRDIIDVLILKLYIKSSIKHVNILYNS